MDGQIQPISTLRLSTPLQNCCIGLAIAAFGVIICYFWLDRPLALFLHGNVADKTIFVWLQRVPLAQRDVCWHIRWLHHNENVMLAKFKNGFSTWSLIPIGRQLIKRLQHRYELSA